MSPPIGGRRINADTYSRQRAFLRRYGLTGKLVTAMHESGISTSLHYLWLRKDPNYVRMFEITTKLLQHRLEDEAYRRAHDGVLEPVGFYKGEPTTHVLRFSDNLLMFLLKKLDPAYARERYEVTGKNGGPIDISTQPIPLNRISSEAQLQILEILERELGAGFDNEKLIGAGDTRDSIDAEIIEVDDFEDTRTSIRTPGLLWGLQTIKMQVDIADDSDAPTVRIDRG